MHAGAMQDIMRILQEGYGDQAMTPLDRAVANRILTYFVENGWMSPGEVGYLVDAAGGQIRVPESLVTKPPKALMRTMDELNQEFVFKTVDTTNAKVNPDAESRGN